MYLKKELYELIQSDESIFDFIQNSALDGLWYWDLENHENEWMNAKFWTVLGYNPDEMPHKSSAWQNIINSDDLKVANENFIKHCENPNHPYDQVVRYTHKDGSTVWIRCRGLAIRDKNGKPIRMLGAHQDISDIKRNEQELFKAKEKAEESEAKYRTLFENMNTGFVLFEVVQNEHGIPIDLIILAANEGFEKTTGLNLKASFGKRLKEVLQGIEKDEAEWIETYSKVALTGESIHFEQGSELLGHYYSISAYQAGTKQCAVTFVDITERKQAQLLLQKKIEETVAQNEELQKLNAQKDKFFSIIAHDLKSPFNSIMGFSEILIEQISKKDYKGIEKYAGIILQSSQKAVDLLMNLMEWAQSQTGRMEFNPERFDLTEFIHDITSLFDEIAGQKGIIIKNELPQKATVVADHAMINTVLRNLISNAVKFTKQDGEIILAVTKEKNELTVSVKDNGIGIPKDRVEKLFHIEESESTSGTADEKGTGLGLILCKEFIEKHDEKIWVESEEGTGSTFYFTLPYNTKPAAGTIEHHLTASEENSDVRKLKILIAEDDEVSKMLIDKYIRMQSKEIVKARTGVEAVKACRDNPDIDLILMDIRMPEMSGFEATKQIREFNKDVVIIAQTACSLTRDREKSIDAGCDDYIAKPIKKIELQALIKKHFGEKP